MFRKLRTLYAIDLSIDRFTELQELVDNAEWSGPVGTALEAIEAIEGVRVTGMNPHFGTSVFIEIVAENDTPETHERIAEVLSSL